MRHLVVGIWAVMVVVSGCANQHEKNKQAALQRWNKARVEIMVDMARGQFEGGELKKAAGTCQNAISTNPQYVPGHLLLGRIYLEQDLPVKAQESFARCLEIEPGHAEANFYLGIIQERWNKLTEAQQYYQQAWESQSDKSKYLLALVETKMTLGEPEEALALLRGNRDKVERDATIWVTEGNILTSLGRYEEAVGAFQEASSKSPDNDSIKEMLAFSLHRANRCPEALELFERLSGQKQSAPGGVSWVIYLAMGDCYMKLEQYLPAQHCFEKVSECDKNNPVIWTRLAQVLLARGELTRAKSCAQKACSLKEDNTDALLVLGYVAMQEQKYQEGAQIYTRIISIDDKEVLAYGLLGQCLQACGQEEQAQMCFEQALKIDPSDRLARRLRQSGGGTEIGIREGSKSF